MPYLTIDRADAGRARAAATTIAGAAAQLRRSAATVVAEGHRPIWSGPSSVWLRTELEFDAAALRQLAVRTDRIVEELEQHAAWISRETDRLDNVRASVRQSVAAHPEHPISIELATTGEPPRWNLRWDRLADQIGAPAAPLFFY